MATPAPKYTDPLIERVKKRVVELKRERDAKLSELQALAQSTTNQYNAAISELERLILEDANNGELCDD